MKKYIACYTPPFMLQVQVITLLLTETEEKLLWQDQKVFIFYKLHPTHKTKTALTGLVIFVSVGLYTGRFSQNYLSTCTGCERRSWQWYLMYIVCLLLDIPGTNLVFLKDKSAQTCKATCCHTEWLTYTDTDIADQTCYLTKSQFSDTGPNSLSTNSAATGTWQGSHKTTIFHVTGIAWLGKVVVVITRHMQRIVKTIFNKELSNCWLHCNKHSSWHMFFKYNTASQPVGPHHSQLLHVSLLASH